MKKMWFAGVLLLLIILTGCQPKSSGPPTTGAFIGGKEGVLTTLSVESAKPNEVLDANLESFRINVNLQNKGEYSINEKELM
ncbi:hypothetical protein HZB00_00290, partial [Candidatus Woesearchaeota archaeon]|nr:hypothetical protein [Candidatus Woesearchaeota archaeon]